MNVFRCDHCANLLFFENVLCLSCQHSVGFVPELASMVSMEKCEGSWRTSRTGTTDYRLCSNYELEAVCNWLIPADDPNALCRSCRLTRVIPDLTLPDGKASWYRLEVAKRRLLYGLLRLRLPFEPSSGDVKDGMSFVFLAEQLGGEPVLTGHQNGVITINVAEADDAEREKRRGALHEPYRTLLGHFRHESGHYFWDRLIQNSPVEVEFRALFGDERSDYSNALARHHDAGPPTDWHGQFISAYASAHPWEDWAETWAHYLHMMDALETAGASGLTLQPRLPGDPALTGKRRNRLDRAPFDQLIADWNGLTHVLNNLNRGLGLPDGYPFVLSPPVVEKLGFVHKLVSSFAADGA